MKRWIIPSFFIGLLLLCAGGCEGLGGGDKGGGVLGRRQLSDPKKTVDTCLEAMIRDDKATMMACIYCATEADRQLMDAELDCVIARRQMAKAAVARFGEEGKRWFKEPFPFDIFDEDYQKLREQMKAGVVIYTGDKALVKSRPGPNSGTEMLARKIGGVWKLCPDDHPKVAEKDEERRKEERQGETKLYRLMASRIASGSYNEVVEAKAALAAMEAD